MPVIVNIREAKTQFSKLLARVANGEEIVIARAGVPVARLTPFVARPAHRVPGSARGTLVVPENFNDSLPEDELASFK